MTTIDRMELREQIAALEEVRKPLQEAVDTIDRQKQALIDAEIDREREIYERELRERKAAFVRRCDEIREGFGQTDAEAALEAHDQHEAYAEALDYDENGFAVRCCVSDLVLLEDDEIVEDSLGRKALAAALPGWPEFDGDDEFGDAPDAGGHPKAQGERGCGSAPEAQKESA